MIPGENSRYFAYTPGQIRAADHTALDPPTPPSPPPVNPCATIPLPRPDLLSVAEIRRRITPVYPLEVEPGFDVPRGPYSAPSPMVMGDLGIISWKEELHRRLAAMNARAATQMSSGDAKISYHVVVEVTYGTVFRCRPEHAGAIQEAMEIAVRKISEDFGASIVGGVSQVR